jgi:antirestriction protein ArdC
MKIADLYQSVTNAIVADLEKGVASWVKPWKTGNAGGIMPVNAATKHSYHGVNIPILWHAQITRGFPTAQWMTYKQALPLDAHVRKGEQGTTVVFTKKLTFKEKDSEEEKRISMLRTYTVFNIAQIDGLPSEPPPTEQKAQPQDTEPFQTLIDNCGGIARAFSGPPCDCGGINRQRFGMVRFRGLRSSSARWATSSSLGLDQLL